MAAHQTFLSTGPESKFNNSVQRTVHETRARNDRGIERKKDELIALPPVRATTNSEHQMESTQLSPLNKWQLQRCSSPNPGYCQEELVNDWLHRNHIRVVQRLPKMDPIVLTSRGADVSKYISFIRPPPFSLKVFSTEEKGSKDSTHKRTQTVSPESISPCPRLLRSQRSDRADVYCSEMHANEIHVHMIDITKCLTETDTTDRKEMFSLNPVIRVGGGYRRLSWKVLDVLPSIGQYDPDFSPAYSCPSCHARLPVTQKVTNSRGQLRTILATPKRCHKCGTPTTDDQMLSERDLHESVLDTLHRGDSRFIVDHRRFQNLSSRDSQSSVKNNDRIWASSSPLDWHDDMESYRLHMSRQSQLDDNLETRDQASEQKRSESASSVFITEPGANIDRINETPDVRRAWDDGSSQAEVTRNYENESANWGQGKETGSYSSDNDNDAFSDFEMIEDYDPESGFTVRLRRRPFGAAQKTSYTIHIQDDDALSENLTTKGRRPRHRDKESVRNGHENVHSRKKANKEISADKKSNRKHSHAISDEEAEFEKVKPDKNKTTKGVKSPRHSLPRTDSFYTVRLDRRDYVFTEEPVLQETDEDDVIIDPRTRFSEDSLSEIEFIDDSWSPDPLVPGALGRPSVPSPADQDSADYSSSLSISPAQHDGYLADSEENVDLSSLQAQIKQARNDAKKQQRRKEEEQETRRKESKGRKEKTTEGSLSHNPQDKDTSDRVPLQSGDWDSDWDSDFSLHVQPLSDLSVSSSEEDPWENGNQRRTSSPAPQGKARKGSYKTTSNDARQKRSKQGDMDLNEGTLNGGADRVEPRRRSVGEDHVRERKSSRKTVVKPIPSIGPGSDSEDALPRPRFRAPRDEDDLSESDLSFFAQQFQAPYPRKDQENGPTGEGPVGCKGITCYRCGALIPECQGVCTKCGTLCQRPGGPCSACRDVCESCGKPRYRCTSADERLEASEDEKGKQELMDSDGLEAKPIVQGESEMTFRGEDHSPALVSAEKTRLHREESPTMVGGDQNVQKKKERKSRAPPERKKKDANNIKRVRAKLSNTSVNEEREQELANEPVNEADEETEDKVEEEKLDIRRQSTEAIPVEDNPPNQKPSAFPTKSIKKSKPSKKVISQTVVYKEKEKPPKAKRKSLQQQENTLREDLVVTSPTPAEETVETGEEMQPVGEGGTGEEVRLTEQKVRDEATNNVNEIGDDVNTKPEDEGKTGNEKIGKENEKEEQQQKEEEKENVVPKVRGVIRVNAAFKERAELAKRLQSVLKEAVSDVIGQADIKTRKDSSIDYLAQYRLVDRSHLEMYGRAFTLEDEDEDGIISYEQMLLALEGVPSIAGMSRKQLLFVLQVLELFPGSRITFKMFSVTTALCEKVIVLDEFVQQLVEELDLFDLECKLDLFRNMFFVTGDFSVNFITADQLRIELKAGGLNQQQEDHVIGHILQSTQSREISFLDYMAYLPLFLSIHKNICNNALDMSRNKYQRKDTT